VLVSAPGAATHPVALPVTLTVTARRSPGRSANTGSHCRRRRLKNVGHLCQYGFCPGHISAQILGRERESVEALAGRADGSSRRSLIQFPWVDREPSSPTDLQRRLRVGSAELSAKRRVSGGECSLALPARRPAGHEAAVPITPSEAGVFVALRQYTGLRTGWAVANPMSTPSEWCR